MERNMVWKKPKLKENRPGNRPPLSAIMSFESRIDKKITVSTRVRRENR